MCTHHCISDYSGVGINNSIASTLLYNGFIGPKEARKRLTGKCLYIWDKTGFTGNQSRPPGPTVTYPSSLLPGWHFFPRTYTWHFLSQYLLKKQRVLIHSTFKNRSVSVWTTEYRSSIWDREFRRKIHKHENIQNKRITMQMGTLERHASLMGTLFVRIHGYIQTAYEWHCRTDGFQLFQHLYHFPKGR